MKTTKTKKIITWAVLIIVILVFMFPLYYNISTSFKSQEDVATSPPTWIFKPTLVNYQRIIIPGFVSKKLTMTLSGGHLLNNLKNSLIICFSSVLISVSIGIFAAYSLARLSFSHKEDLAFWIISIRMMPPIAVIIPFFLLSNTLHLYDSYPLMIAIYITFNLPLAVWIMRGFFEDIPPAIEESAMVDGCSRPQAFFRVILPLVSPGLVATTIICLIFSWNEFFMAFILTGRHTQTLSVGVSAFMTPWGIQWGPLAAANSLIIAPIIIIAIAIQKYLVRGLTFGAIK